MKKRLHSKGGGVSLKRCAIRALICCFTLLLFSLPSIAQTRVISGTITDDKGTTLIGVSVKLKNSKTGATTDANGKFKISVAGANPTLVFVYVGYLTQELPLAGQSTVTVKLQEDNQKLQEVVVTGYGSQKRESITGSIASVTSKDIERVHGGATVSTTLAGKIPGVTFRQTDGRPGSSASIQIRNMGTPLYVIDGIQQDAGQFNNIAPNDIESISVLKDASAAIYGVRAANGVVVVTTKKGAQGDSRINVDAYIGAQNWSRFPDVVRTSYDYMRYRAEAEMNSNGNTSITPVELEKYRLGTDPAYRSFDWREYVLKSNNNAPQNSVNINFTGGTDKMSY
jgi:TonB-dependent SusC/RagA subfamily outer membrane receptor